MVVLGLIILFLVGVVITKKGVDQAIKCNDPDGTDDE